MDTHSELAYTIALTSLKGIGSIRARLLLQEFGSAEAVFRAEASRLKFLRHVGDAIIEQRSNPQLIARAEEEIRFAESHHIQTLIYGQPGYPQRLMECPDAPCLLYYLGEADLDSPHIVGIVGTRSCSMYGRDQVAKFVQGLKQLIPDIIVISGLALGIDVSAHKAALKEEVTTVGVVAHGLDRVYPQEHRQIAKQMLMQHGGLITEYTTRTEPERGNFLARNRIIAGLSDAIIVAESKAKGGSLVTASIAADYYREVFAFPGRISDVHSEGCNRLIRQNKAGLITCAEDFVEAMNWGSSTVASKSIQQSIPFEEDNLSPHARLIVDTLSERGDLLISQLTEATGLNHSILFEELLNLEMEGKIRSTPGGLYQLR